MDAEFERSIGQRELDVLLSQFRSHMDCWKVGLHYGSVVYFELGRLSVVRLPRRHISVGGSSTLLVEGFSWTALSNGQVITESDNVTKHMAERVMGKKFVRQTLDAIHVNHEEISANVVFSDGLSVRISELKEDPEYQDQNLFSLFLPDNTVVVFCADKGLYIANAKGPQ